MVNNSNNKIKALAYKANYETLEKFYDSETFKYIGKKKLNNNYIEFVVSKINVIDELNDLIRLVKNKQFELDNRFFLLNNSICRVVYIKSKECIFLIGDDLDYCGKIANGFNLKPYNLLNERVLKKFINGDIPELYEIEIILKEERSKYSMNLRGINLVKSDDYKKYLKNATEVVSYKRRLNTFEVQVKDTNYIEMFRISRDFNLHKSLSLCIIGGINGE